MYQPNQPGDVHEQHEALLSTQVHTETCRRIKRLAELYAVAGVPRASVPAHILALLDADLAHGGSAAATLERRAERVEMDALTDHALLLADGKNGYRLWWGMSWNAARDTPTWWPEAA
jgi:hypothetical protein